MIKDEIYEKNVITFKFHFCKCICSNPNTVTLEGRVILQEAQTEDAKQPVRYRVLQLNKPKNLLVSDEYSEDNVEISNVQNLQLAGVNAEKIYKLPLKTRIKANCELFSAHTGHHFTDVLCTVHSFKVLK